MRKHSCTTLVAAGLYAAATGTLAVDLRLDPPCPTPSAPGLLIATSQGAGPAYVEALSSSLVDVRTLKVVYRALPGDPDGAVRVAQSPLPPLPPGDYALQTYYRLDTGFLEPEVKGAVSDFRVEASAGINCSPWRVILEAGTPQDTLVASPFPYPLGVLVVDHRGSPVSGANVRFHRVAVAGDVGLPGASGADATLSGEVTISDDQGRVRVSATANATAGSYGYAASVTHANVTDRAYFDLRNRAAASPGGLTQVVEYVHSSNGHYFITSNPAEMALLDDGVMTGWKRTGAMFSAVPDDDAAASPVCRLYGRPEAGLDSHFFSASPAECADTLSRFPQAWILETNRAFSAWLPDFTTGVCAKGVPLYRVFNQRADGNHRYLLSNEGAQAMVDTLGWVREGYGPEATAMCVEP